MKPSRLFTLLVSVAVSAMPLASHAADGHAEMHAAIHANHAQAGEGTGAANIAGNTASEGEVKKIDKGTGKLTIKHGELKNLDMPPMTMVFRVKDKAMLEQVKQGDRVRFVAEQIDGKLTVVRLDPAQ
jgi:Cu(I)/Ag(I) efflux system periplasmic protein CusF